MDHGWRMVQNADICLLFLVTMWACVEMEQMTVG